MITANATPSAAANATLSAAQQAAFDDAVGGFAAGLVLVMTVIFTLALIIVLGGCQR